MGFLRSFVYAGRGIWFCIRHERNFRIHMVAAAYVLLFAPYFSLTRGEWAALLAIIGLVTAAEAVNTAVEQTVNLAAPGRRKTAPAAAAGVLLFARWEVWLCILSDFRTNWWKPLLLLLSLPLSLWFIISGGRRRQRPIPPRRPQ